MKDPMVMNVLKTKKHLTEISVNLSTAQPDIIRLDYSRKRSVCAKFHSQVKAFGIFPVGKQLDDILVSSETSHEVNFALRILLYVLLRVCLLDDCFHGYCLQGGHEVRRFANQSHLALLIRCNILAWWWVLMQHFVVLVLFCPLVQSLLCVLTKRRFESHRL